MATDPQEPFTVSTLVSGGEVVLTPSGEIDLHASPQLLEAGLRALDGGPRTLTIDCHSTSSGCTQSATATSSSPRTSW